MSDLLVCSGAPLDASDDKRLGQIVREWEGKIVVCGGTTAKIIAREMGRTITVNLNAKGSTLPPTSTIAGIDIVSEGVITLGCVRRLLRELATVDDRPTFLGLQTSVDVRIAYELLAHRRIMMVVGTRLNPAHFDPRLPVCLERRVDMLQEITQILRTEFRKTVDVEYL